MAKGAWHQYNGRADGSAAAANEVGRNPVDAGTRTGILVPAKTAPCRYVDGGRGIVGHHRHDAADADIADVPRELDDR